MKLSTPRFTFLLLGIMFLTFVIATTFVGRSNVASDTAAGRKRVVPEFGRYQTETVNRLLKSGAIEQIEPTYTATNDLCSLNDYTWLFVSRFEQSCGLQTVSLYKTTLTGSEIAKRVGAAVYRVPAGTSAELCGGLVNEQKAVSGSVNIAYFNRQAANGQDESSCALPAVPSRNGASRRDVMVSESGNYDVSSVDQSVAYVILEFTTGYYSSRVGCTIMCPAPLGYPVTGQ